MKIRWPSVAIVLLLLPLSAAFSRPANAQVNVQVQIAVPTIRFETAPVLVEVSPGVQVVPDYDEEVFFVDGWYWYRSGPVWYRTRDHRGGWVVVHERSVPPTLVRIPRGRYKHYRAKGPHVNEQRRPMAASAGDAHFKHRDKDDNRGHEHREQKEHGKHKESKHGRR